MPSALNPATICSRSSPGPESTVLGPLYAPIDTRGNWAAAASTRLASVNTATMRPPGGRLPNIRPRSAISRTPSSRLNTPATQAAAYWPTL